MKILTAMTASPIKKTPTTPALGILMRMAIKLEVLRITGLSSLYLEMS